jgi:5-hydroxyisourate hydrolase
LRSKLQFAACGALCTAATPNIIYRGFSMGMLTTHVLDTMNGCPAVGMRVLLYRLGQVPTAGATASAELLSAVHLNDDGRAPGPLLDTSAFKLGRYRLVFEVAEYFRMRGVELPDPPFLDEVPIDFGVADLELHYHVPLLTSPWAYSTYRGS